MWKNRGTETKAIEYKARKEEKGSVKEANKYLMRLKKRMVREKIEETKKKEKTVGERGERRQQRKQGNWGGSAWKVLGLFIHAACLKTPQITLITDTRWRSTNFHIKNKHSRIFFHKKTTKIH